jgi:hypothetical protein
MREESIMNVASTVKVQMDEAAVIVFGKKEGTKGQGKLVC